MAGPGFGSQVSLWLAEGFLERNYTSAGAATGALAIRITAAWKCMG